MHYIRLLRPPKLAISSKKTCTVELILTVNTDLGDSLLYPDEPVELVASAHVTSPSGESTFSLSSGGKLFWRSGDRVSKPTYDLPPTVAQAIARGHRVELCISPAPPLSADGLENILRSSTGPATAPESAGLVMPVWVMLRNHEAAKDLCTRKLRLNGADAPAEFLELEEEMGESISRHIWDSSPVVLAAIAGIHRFPELISRESPCMQALQRLLATGETLNILELGCGVGILGAGLSALCAPTLKDCTILMTDLEEAEGRARTNLGLMTHSQSGHAKLLYENLDWEEGRHGRFGPLLQQQRWDLVALSDCTYNTDTLPALVETLSAVHAHNVAQGSRSTPTKVFVATKQRHSSERIALDLLARDGWQRLAEQTVRLPVLGGEDQMVEMYIFEKS
ncbi:hypothetical protein HIM_01972 [Hirsutella minnesotensis 3608]|nr:hypothetical protein HIM_01972 [Hirsutella minnesotensis 3608]